MKIHYLILALGLIFITIFPISITFSQYDPGQPDTVRFGKWSVDLSGPPYQGKAFLPVVVFNDEVVGQIDIPLTWTGPLSCDSGKFVGERSQHCLNTYFTINNEERWLVASAVAGEPVEPFFIPPGEGDFVHLYFSVLDTGFISIDSLSMFGFLHLRFYDTLGIAIYPQFVPTELHILPPLAGDVNGDGVVNIGDVVTLINYLFRDSPPPEFLERGDVNGDCEVDIGDVVYLINYLFKNGLLPQNGCDSP